MICIYKNVIHVKFVLTRASLREIIGKFNINAKVQITKTRSDNKLIPVGKSEKAMFSALKYHTFRRRKPEDHLHRIYERYFDLSFRNFFLPVHSSSTRH